MRITSHLFQGSLIGLHAKIVRSSDSTHVGVEGKVIDESRNTLLLAQGGEEKVIVKDVAVFHFTLPDGTIVEVDGGVIVGRPEDRIKRRRDRRRW
jgi:ribonuclease P protein subunit POP4